MSEWAVDDIEDKQLNKQVAIDELTRFGYLLLKSDHFIAVGTSITFPEDTKGTVIDDAPDEEWNQHLPQFPREKQRYPFLYKVTVD